jgi:hypothetical protein
MAMTDKEISDLRSAILAFQARNKELWLAEQAAAQATLALDALLLRQQLPKG